MLEVKQALAERPTGSHGHEGRSPVDCCAPLREPERRQGKRVLRRRLAEEIINALPKVPELRVIARTSAFAFRGKEQDLRTIGQRLKSRNDSRRQRAESGQSHSGHRSAH
jgi:TolB-like protein